MPTEKEPRPLTPTTSTTPPKSSGENSLSDDQLHEIHTVSPVEGGGDELGDDMEKQQTEVSIHHPAAFPDGGLQAWLCVFGGFCCFFCSFGWINCIGFFQDYYQANQLSSYSPSAVSWISSLETFCMFAGGAFIGKLFDSHGPRYILLLGTFLHVFGLMMTSLSQQYWHFVIAQGIVSAVGASMIFYPAVSCVSTWFFKRRAFALGIVAAGSSLGGVLFPIMIRRLIPVVGFGWTMRATAFCILGMMLIANVTLKSRLPPKGATPWRISDFTRHFTELPYALTVLASFMFYFGMFLPFNYLPVYAQHHGMSADLAAYLISILNACSILGRIIPGYIGDKAGRYNTMAVICTISAISVLALWLPTTGNAPTIVFAAIYGFTTGSFVSLSPALVAQISDIREIGLRSGALFMTISIATLTGSPIGGALVDTYDGEYTGLQIFSGVTLAVGSVGFLVVRFVLTEGRMKEVV